MSSMQRIAICLTLVAAGVLTPWSAAHAVTNTIRGNLVYNDGISVIAGGDTFTVEPTASDGKSTYFTVTPGASSYSFTFDPAALPAADRSITINFKLNGVVDRTAAGVDGNAPRMQTIDIGFTKAPTMVMTNSANTVVRGTMYYKDGATPVAPQDSPKLVVKDANNNLVATLNGPVYSLSITASTLPANKTVTIEYWIGGGANRTATGVIGNDARLQTLDITVNK